MRVHLYTLSWNEMKMLGFFFRHYDPLIERYVFYDDGSTDGTLDVLRAHQRVEIRRFERHDADSFVLSSRHLNDHVWKESRGLADWVVISAVDEHLYHRDLPRYLELARRAGITAIPGLGYEMVSADFPDPAEELTRTRTRGAAEPMWNKLNLFDPDAVDETNYEVGRHTANPTGRLPIRKPMSFLFSTTNTLDSTMCSGGTRCCPADWAPPTGSTSGAFNSIS
jgi:Glycosyl transferase family 2